MVHILQCTEQPSTWGNCIYQTPTVFLWRGAKDSLLAIYKHEIYIYIYVYILYTLYIYYILIYINIYFMFVCIYTHIYTYIYIHICIYVYMYICEECVFRWLRPTTQQERDWGIFLTLKDDQRKSFDLENLKTLLDNNGQYFSELSIS